jgi:hypothetical protein
MHLRSSNSAGEKIGAQVAARVAARLGIGN